MTRVRPKGRRSLIALLFVALTASSAAWVGLLPGTASATPTNLLGTDGRYTLLFLGTDKRCSGHAPGDTAERCPNLEANASDPALNLTPSDAARWTASSANDALLKLPSTAAGSERTDVITLLTVDPYAGTASALSIPRDTYYFPLKPSLAGSFCSPGRKTFGHTVNALYVYAQLCAPGLKGRREWERSVAGAELVRQDIAWALGIEIDDWTLSTFGTSDVLGAALDAATDVHTTPVRLNGATMFAACRTNVVRSWSHRNQSVSALRYVIDGHLAANARYGDLVFVVPDRSNTTTLTSFSNCAEPDSSPATPATTVPNFIGGSTGDAQCTGTSTSGCLFNVPSALWTSFARVRKYAGDDGARVQRHQRLIAGIALRVIDAGKPVAEILAGLASLRWYYTYNPVTKKSNAGPALVRGTISVSDVGALYDIIASARAALEAGPDAPGGWHSYVLSGGRSNLNGVTCRVAGSGGLFTRTRRALPAVLACTRAWLTSTFGPTAHRGAGAP